MAKLLVEKTTRCSSKEAFLKVKTLLETDDMLRRLDSNLICQFDEVRLEGCAKGGQFRADLRVEPQSGGAKVAIDVTLSFLLGPLKEKVRSVLQKKLDECLD